MKTIYCIRHGTALHNELYKYIGNRAFTEFKDTHLTTKGYNESINLGETWNKINDIDLVLVSPLTRTLQTAMNIFKNKKVKILAIDELMEHPQSKDICNQRLDKNILLNQYPNIDFSKISDDHLLYWENKYNFTNELERLKKRIIEFKLVLNTFNEKNIVIISHSSFLRQLMFNKIDNNYELLHCFPYEYNINHIPRF